MHLIETTLTLLAYASMPLTYWDETIRASAYLINRLPSTPLHGKIPFTMLHKEKPDYGLFKGFWLCMLSQPSSLQSTQAPSKIYILYFPWL